ncbi:helix-turn-helix transcriptional regulator [Silvimonas iriomotensis]|uniref:Transcriptional regulator n=1 Tax=Silvimonas iriomotensis TaxID=449662 RepID=A0ABQ2P7X5_9NEIS|nr:helix-turn-helix transcriptional regulator [Silvimonas iriomotensis]GGP20562.1 transcriptional regulator [Silvimonas iriomotensis]
MSLERWGSAFSESIGDMAGWTDTLNEVRLQLNSRGLQFGLTSGIGFGASSRVIGFDPADLAVYMNHYAATDPRIPFIARHPGQIVICNQHVDTKQFERSALVNDFLDKHDARHAMAVALPLGDRCSVTLSAMRAHRDGEYTDADLQRFSQIAPTLQYAFRLHLRLGVLETTLCSLSTMVDQLRTPVLLLTSGAMLVHANKAALQALASGQVLEQIEGCIRPVLPAEQPGFRRRLQATIVASDAWMPTPGTFRLGVRAGRFIHAEFVALKGVPKDTAAKHASVALYLQPPAAQPPQFHAYRTMFGFTAAEARLAEHLCRGQSLQHIATELHLSRETLKSQLKGLFAKTDTHRQIELVNLLQSTHFPFLR